MNLDSRALGLFIGKAFAPQTQKNRRYQPAANALASLSDLHVHDVGVGLHEPVAYM